MDMQTGVNAYDMDGRIPVRNFVLVTPNNMTLDQVAYKETLFQALRKDLPWWGALSLQTQNVALGDVDLDAFFVQYFMPDELGTRVSVLVQPQYFSFDDVSYLDLL